MENWLKWTLVGTTVVVLGATTYVLIANNNEEKNLETIDGNQLGETPQEPPHYPDEYLGQFEELVEDIEVFVINGTAVNNFELEVGESIIISHQHLVVGD